jgi:hypothetical protein
MANRTEGSGYERPTRWVADVAVPITPHIHAVDRGRVLCAKALGYAVPASVNFGLGSAQPSATVNAPISVSRRPVVVLVHGTSRADKEWPLSHWHELGQRLKATGLDVVLPHGNEEERLRSLALADMLPGAHVWPRLSLDQLTTEMAQCTGVIGVDSGLSHIAVALDLPHVQIYNFDTAWRTGPEGLRRQNRCPPMWRVSMRVVITRTVYGWVLQALQPLLRRKLKRRGVDEPGYLVAIDERFGHYTQPSAAQSGVAYVWVHAVSLGETRAAAVLLQALREAMSDSPALKILLTHGTATGR